MSYTSSSSYNSKHNSKHDCIFAIICYEKLIKEILPRLSLLTRRRPVTSHLSLQVRPGPLAGLRPGLPHCRAGRGLGLPHGHRLLGQEVRLHVGRRQQRHVRPQGAPGTANMSVNSEEWIVKARVDKEEIMMVSREEDPITMLPNDGNSMALKTQILELVSLGAIMLRLKLHR